MHEIQRAIKRGALRSGLLAPLSHVHFIFLAEQGQHIQNGGHILVQSPPESAIAAPLWILRNRQTREESPRHNICGD